MCYLAGTSMSDINCEAMQEDEQVEAKAGTDAQVDWSIDFI